MCEWDLIFCASTQSSSITTTAIGAECNLFMTSMVLRVSTNIELRKCWWLIQPTQLDGERYTQREKEREERTKHRQPNHFSMFAFNSHSTMLNRRHKSINAHIGLSIQTNIVSLFLDFWIPFRCNAYKQKAKWWQAPAQQNSRYFICIFGYGISTHFKVQTIRMSTLGCVSEPMCDVCNVISKSENEWAKWKKKSIVAEVQFVIGYNDWTNAFKTICHRNWNIHRCISMKA